MPNDKEINKRIAAALKEDAAGRDITTKTLIPRGNVSVAAIVVKEKAIICGLDIVCRVFTKLDRAARFRFFCKDGDWVSRNTKVNLITAKTRAILSGERVALNFLSYLSGIATTTASFVAKVHPYKVRIMDTRKTTPGLRSLE